MNSAVLLLDKNRAQSVCALPYAKEFFDVRQVQEHSRTDKRLRHECFQAKYLLNFLSAPYVPRSELDKFKHAINFHPAPPEYPGVGSASLAIWDNRPTHGVTAHVMDEQFDHGEILRVRRFGIDPNWGYKALFERALEETLLLFMEVCRDIAADRPLKQYDGGWNGKAVTRKEFEAHPSFVAVSE